MGTINNIPKRNGTKIRCVLSNINCFQFRFLMAKQTPIPDTKNNNGILHILIIDMGIQIDSNGFFTLDKAYQSTPGLKHNGNMIDQ